jgi:hypothetical protein
MSTRVRPGPAARASAWIFLACGIWMVGLGAYFVLLRPPLLPEDPRFIGSSLPQIRAALPGLERWLNQVFNVMGGFMAGSGVDGISRAHCCPRQNQGRRHCPRLRWPGDSRRHELGELHH